MSHGRLCLATKLQIGRLRNHGSNLESRRHVHVSNSPNMYTWAKSQAGLTTSLSYLQGPQAFRGTAPLHQRLTPSDNIYPSIGHPGRQGGCLRCFHRDLKQFVEEILHHINDSFSVLFPITTTPPPHRIDYCTKNSIYSALVYKHEMVFNLYISSQLVG